MKWLLIVVYGQHDEAIYTEFMTDHPDSVAGVAIRQLSVTEARLAGGRATSDDHSEDTAPWVAASDGAGLRERLTDVGILH